IHLLRAPEERQLLLDQFLEDRVFLLVVTGHVDRLAEEHRLAHLVIVGLGKGAVFHFHSGPSRNLKSLIRCEGARSRGHRGEGAAPPPTRGATGGRRKRLGGTERQDRRPGAMRAARPAGCHILHAPRAQSSARSAWASSAPSWVF